MTSESRKAALLSEQESPGCGVKAGQVGLVTVPASAARSCTCPSASLV